jgi:hypothetical protein
MSIQYFMIHDNMARPFRVAITDDQISIYRHPPFDSDADSSFDEDNEEQYTELVHQINNYLDVFVGADSNKSEFEGNTILVHTMSKNGFNHYTLIEGSIYSFKTTDKIRRYMSPVGNSDVPYHYAIGEENVYITWNKSYGPIDGELEDDPGDETNKYNIQMTTRTIIERER